jgi:glutamate--cysteine ligase
MVIQDMYATPHLTTALHGQLERLESHLLSHQADIERWLRLQWQNTPAPFYASVDLRNAGFKLAPIDTNLFPAGFNNLSPSMLPLCVQAIQSAIERLNVSAYRILLIPENHTRNLYYLESVATLRDMVQKAGYEVRIGSLLPDLETPQKITLPSNKTLLLEPIIRENDCISVKGFKPCIVLLNNDLSSGQPTILQGLQQKILPPLHLGWSNRLKSSHFTHYTQVVQEFSKQIDIDSWLIDPLFKNCGKINFMKKEGYECLADNVEVLLNGIRSKYNEYNISHQPFVIIKADSGSYGMGVMTVHSGDDIIALNRKQRTRMSSTKEGQTVQQVILQEGVYTFETWGANNAVAEPVVYMIDHSVIGGFYRVHTERGVNENLNAPGMSFEPLAFANSCITPDLEQAPDADPNRFYAYGVIARLALLTAAREIND